MLSLLARIIFLLLLIALIVLGIIAIQYPALWHRDWRVVEQHWHQFQEKLAKKPAAAPPVVKPTPAPSAVPPHPVPITAPAPAAQKTQLNTRQLALLMAARRAYWIGNYPVALSDYRALLSAKPNIPALYGEYGNVLWHLGQSVSAANAYAHAARLLIQQGHYQQAANLIPMLSRLNPSAAGKVETLLAQ